MSKVILFQGDSISDCARSREVEAESIPNLWLGNGYPALVAARLLCDKPKLDLQFHNRAISGNRVVDLYARWKRDALYLNPDILSIMIGVNDTWHKDAAIPNGVEVPRAKKVYHDLLEWTNEVLPKTKLVLMEPYVLHFGVVQDDWVTEVAQRSAYTAELAKEFGALFIPTQQLLNDACQKAPAEYWLRDGVHPIYAGHQLFADAWIKATQQWFR
ncbi:MAG: SGNH/GDSL hydrolase family protein [Lentisphaeria bacterium]